jgi:hypothetical protein
MRNLAEQQGTVDAVEEATPAEAAEEDDLHDTLQQVLLTLRRSLSTVRLPRCRLLQEIAPVGCWHAAVKSQRVGLAVARQDAVPASQSLRCRQGVCAITGPYMSAETRDQGWHGNRCTPREAGRTCTATSTCVQVREDQAKNTPSAPQAGEAGSEVMQRAANSERAKRIVPALSQQNDAFRCATLMGSHLYHAGMPLSRAFMMPQPQSGAVVSDMTSHDGVCGVCMQDDGNPVCRGVQGLCLL